MLSIEKMEHLSQDLEEPHQPIVPLKKDNTKLSVPLNINKITSQGSTNSACYLIPLSIDKICLIKLPEASELDWCFFSSSIISLTDFSALKHELIWGKSNFSWGSLSGSLLYFAKSAVISWLGSSELYHQ